MIIIQADLGGMNPRKDGGRVSLYPKAAKACEG